MSQNFPRKIARLPGELLAKMLAVLVQHEPRVSLERKAGLFEFRLELAEAALPEVDSALLELYREQKRPGCFVFLSF